MAVISAGKPISDEALKNPHKLVIIICDTSTPKTPFMRDAPLCMRKLLTERFSWRSCFIICSHCEIRQLRPNDAPWSSFCCPVS